MTDFKSDFERDLVSIVAHDLKAPVAAARGFIDLIERSGELNETQAKWLNRAIHSLERMETLITNLLNTTRLESELTLKLTFCDLKAIIAETVEIMQIVAQRRQIHIETHIPDDLKPVNGDPEWLSHVVLNLISNAIKFNREGGRIIIRATNQVKAVLVEVQDTGIGIAPEDQTRIFERFYRAQTGERIEGSGLGLAIAEKVIRKHGGKLEVSSTLGAGSTFRFMLPLAPTKRSRSSAQANPLHEAHGGEASDGVEDDHQDSRIPRKVEESRGGDNKRPFPE